MKTMMFLITLSCSLHAVADAMIVKQVPVTPTQTVSLFNGADFSGWTQVNHPQSQAAIRTRLGRS